MDASPEHSSAGRLAVLCYVLESIIAVHYYLRRPLPQEDRTFLGMKQRDKVKQPVINNIPHDAAKNCDRGVTRQYGASRIEMLLESC